MPGLLTGVAVLLIEGSSTGVVVLLREASGLQEWRKIEDSPILIHSPAAFFRRLRRVTLVGERFFIFYLLIAAD
jgi:hypothetical protein